MMPVPYYQVVEFLDWLNRNSNISPQAMSGESLRKYAIAYLRGGRHNEQSVASLFSFQEINPKHITEALLRIFQICPMITEPDIEAKMAHFSRCGQCIRYLSEGGANPVSVQFHPLIHRFFLSEDFSNLQFAMHRKMTDLNLPRFRFDVRDADNRFRVLLERFGPDIAEVFLKFASREENRTLTQDYERTNVGGRAPRHQDDFRGDSAERREMDDDTVPIDLRRRDLETEAMRLADGVRLLVEGYAYEEQVKQNPQVLHFLRALGLLESSSAQALEFIWWLEDKHPKLDILASFPANQLKELVAAFCEEKNYNNAASFSKEVLRWVQGEGERSVLRKLMDISRRLRQRQRVSSSNISLSKRYESVPFHAIFLFLSAGNFPEFIRAYWEDLNYLTADHLDVYYSFEDLERRVSAYETLTEFRTLQVEATWLPAMVLWKRNLSESCVIPFKQLSHEGIFEVVKLVVRDISKRKSIAEICAGANDFVHERTDELLPGAKVILRNGVVTMGDQYNVGQAGAVGRDAKAEKMTFNQIQMNRQDELDVTELSTELSRLREAMLTDAKMPEHFVEIGTVAEAEAAAKKGNKSKAFEALTKVGKWSLDTATAIGTRVAAEAIKISLGM